MVPHGTLYVTADVVLDDQGVEVSGICPVCSRLLYPRRDSIDPCRTLGSLHLDCHQVSCLDPSCQVAACRTTDCQARRVCTDCGRESCEDHMPQVDALDTCEANSDTLCRTCHLEACHYRDCWIDH